MLRSSQSDAQVAFERFVTAQRLSTAELLEFFPSCNPPLEALLDLLPGLPARYYSVASSPLAQPHTLTVSLSVVDYTLTVRLRSLS